MHGIKDTILKYLPDNRVETIALYQTGETKSILYSKDNIKLNDILYDINGNITATTTYSKYNELYDVYEIIKTDMFYENGSILCTKIETPRSTERKLYNEYGVLESSNTINN